jgi:hypothetical protein
MLVSTFAMITDCWGEDQQREEASQTFEFEFDLYLRILFHER